jgi:hypothetical protein
MALYGPDSPPDDWWGTNDVRIEDDVIFDPVEVTFRSPFMSDAEASACPDCWVPFSEFKRLNLFQYFDDAQSLMDAMDIVYRREKELESLNRCDETLTREAREARLEEERIARASTQRKAA